MRFPRFNRRKVGPSPYYPSFAVVHRSAGAGDELRFHRPTPSLTRSVFPARLPQADALLATAAHTRTATVRAFGKNPCWRRTSRSRMFRPVRRAKGARRASQTRTSSQGLGKCAAWRPLQISRCMGRGSSLDCAHNFCDGRKRASTAHVSSPRRRSRKRRTGSWRASSRARVYDLRASAGRSSRRQRSARAAWAR